MKKPNENNSKKKPYKKPAISSQKVPLGGLHTVVCDGSGMGGTKISTATGCSGGRLLS